MTVRSDPVLLGWIQPVFYTKIFWKPLSMESEQPLQAACSSAEPFSQDSISSYPVQTSLFPIYVCCIFSLHMYQWIDWLQLFDNALVGTERLSFRSYWRLFFSRLNKCSSLIVFLHSICSSRWPCWGPSAEPTSVDQHLSCIAGPQITPNTLDVILKVLSKRR